MLVLLVIDFCDSFVLDFEYVFVFCFVFFTVVLGKSKPAYPVPSLHTSLSSSHSPMLSKKLLKSMNESSYVNYPKVSKTSCSIPSLLAPTPSSGTPTSSVTVSTIRTPNLNTTMNNMNSNTAMNELTSDTSIKKDLDKDAGIVGNTCESDPLDTCSKGNVVRFVIFAL